MAAEAAEETVDTTNSAGSGSGSGSGSGGDGGSSDGGGGGGGSGAPSSPSPVPTKIIKCYNPSCSNEGTKRCLGCNVAMYCCKGCSKIDWRLPSLLQPDGHKSACEVIQAVRRKEKKLHLASQSIGIAVSPDLTQIEVGCTVMIQNLVKRADLNGTRAVVKAYDKEKKRWVVKPNDVTTISLRDTNCTRVNLGCDAVTSSPTATPVGGAFPIGAFVELHSLVNKKWLNGITAIYKGFNSKRSRHLVLPDEHEKMILIKRSNIRVPQCMTCGKPASGLDHVLPCDDCDGLLCDESAACTKGHTEACTARQADAAERLNDVYRKCDEMRMEMFKEPCFKGMTIMHHDVGGPIPTRAEQNARIRQMQQSMGLSALSDSLGNLPSNVHECFTSTLSLDVTLPLLKALVAKTPNMFTKEGQVKKQFGGSAFMDKVTGGCSDPVPELYEYVLSLPDVDVFGSDNDGSNALSIALSQGAGYVPIVRMLIAQKTFDPGTLSAYGETYLVDASYPGSSSVHLQLESLKMLLAAGVNPHTPDKRGKTALWGLCSNINIPCALHLLIEHETLDVWKTPAGEETPMQRLKDLLANPTVPDFKKVGAPELVKLLKKRARLQPDGKREFETAEQPKCSLCFRKLPMLGRCVPVPCGHASFCKKCIGPLWGEECPICREKIEVIRGLRFGLGGNIDVLAHKFEKFYV